MSALRGALLALIVGGTTLPLTAQQRRLGIDETPFKLAFSQTYWDWIASSSCAPAPWQPDLSAPTRFAGSVEQLRAGFARRLGPLGTLGGGTVLQRVLVSESTRYRVEFVVVSGRLAPSVYRAFIVTPTEDAPAPAVVLLHGVGTLPRQAFGWRFGGSEPIRHNKPPFDHLAIDLAEMGYTVVVPWIRNDVGSVWPGLPWISLDRAGSLFKIKSGGSGMGLAVSQVQSVLDFVEREPGIDTTRVAAIGWEEGADIAAATAALDPRIKALVRLMPPLDRRRWRATAEGVQANPAFVQIDCTFAEPELAAMIAPRPILHDWTPRDPTFGRARFYVDTTVVDLGRSYYDALHQGGGMTLRPQMALGPARSARIGGWLNEVFGRPRSQALLSGATPPVPGDTKAIVSWQDTSLVSVAAAVGQTGSCPRPLLDLPATTNELEYLAAAAPWRDYLARRLGVPRPEGGPPLRIIIRDTLERSPEFILEWVVTTPTSMGLPLAGLLATPVGVGAPYPALLTFDGDFSAGEPFGLLPGGRTNYLKSYARAAARRGIVVFAPSIPAWFSEAGHSILEARDPQGPTMWGTVLTQVRAATDLLLARTDVDSTRLTLQGISWAGTIALYGAALDTRISTLVYSNPVNTVDSMMVDPTGAQLATWYAPLCGNFNQSQLALIAPRRFIWENGATDNNGFEGSPLEVPRAIERVYDDLGLAGRFHFLRHGGGHEEQPELLQGLDPYRRPADR